MAIEEKEDPQTLVKELIEKIEKDPLPTNIFDTSETDPLVLLGKMNEIIKNLKLFASWVSQSDEKAGEALTKALDALIKSGEALTEATQASTLAEASNTKAIEAENKAENALNKAEIADSTAIEAVNDATEALSKANEALEKVIEGEGTIVFDNHNQVMANAHFTGHNGVNVDMSETDPETFDIRLDNSITEAIENNHTQGQTNKAEIEATKGRVTASEEDIVELTNMLSATEELAQRATEDIRDTINPKLEELESTKLSKSFTNKFGDVFNIDYDTYSQLFELSWKLNGTNTTFAMRISLSGFAFSENGFEIMSGDRYNISILGKPLSAYQNQPAIKRFNHTAGSTLTIDLASAIAGYRSDANYEIVLSIFSYYTGISYSYLWSDKIVKGGYILNTTPNARVCSTMATIPAKRYIYFENNRTISEGWVEILNWRKIL